jgi:hypothetical protein
VAVAEWQRGKEAIGKKDKRVSLNENLFTDRRSPIADSHQKGGLDDGFEGTPIFSNDQFQA